MMDGKEKKDENMSAPLLEADVVLREFGIITKNSLEGRWFSQRDQQDSVDYCYNLVCNTLERVERILLKVTGDCFSVNGHEVMLSDASSRYFLDVLENRDITSLVILKGVTAEELQVFFDNLCVQPAILTERGGLSTALSTAGVNNIKLHRVVYREVTDEQVVVERKDLDAAGLDAEGATEEQVKEILRGGNLSEARSDALKEMAEHDAPALAGMMDSVSEEKHERPRADRVVEMLRKAYAGLRGSGVADTQRGRKVLERMIEQVADELLERRGDESAVADAIKQTVDEITCSLQTETLALAYARQRKLLERNETQILKFLKRHPDTEVATGLMKEQLDESGVDPAEWERMAFRSGTQPELDAPTESETVKQLKELSQRAAEAPDAEISEVDRNALGALLKHLSGEMDQLEQSASRRIDQLVAAIQEDVAVRKKSKGKKATLPRAKLMEMLSEIIQELCQPLSVVSCTPGMLESNSLGEMAQAQIDMVKLARENSERLEGLVNQLRNISGNPDSLSPDSEILSSLYQ